MIFLFCCSTLAGHWHVASPISIYCNTLMGVLHLSQLNKANLPHPTSRVFPRTSRFPRPNMWATSKTTRAPPSWAASSTPAFPTPSSRSSSRSRRKWGGVVVAFFKSLLCPVLSWRQSFHVRSSRSWSRENRLRSGKSTLDSPALRKEFDRFPSRAFPAYVRYGAPPQVPCSQTDVSFLTDFCRPQVRLAGSLWAKGTLPFTAAAFLSAICRHKEIRSSRWSRDLASVFTLTESESSTLYLKLIKNSKKYW